MIVLVGPPSQLKKFFFTAFTGNNKIYFLFLLKNKPITQNLPKNNHKKNGLKTRNKDSEIG